LKNIVVQGLGFVGSAMAVTVASRLNKSNEALFQVKGIDLPNKFGKKRIDCINSGKFPFKTTDIKLSNELIKALKRGNLKATCNKDVYRKTDVVIVSINCDLVKQNSQEKIAIYRFTHSIREIAENISEDTLVIIESTVPPGTCKKIVYPLFEDVFNKRKLNINKFYLAHSYERVMPGDEYFDSIINYWRVYSGINEESSDRCEAFLSKVINIADYPLTRLSNTIASETGKLLENSYRAVNIAFVEEWGRFAEDAGIDLYEVINAIRMRPTHANIRQPGFGVGGYCLTKDPLFAKIAARDILKINGHEFPFSTQAIQVNAEMPLVTLNKLKHYFNGDLNGKKILLMGVTYKQDVGDTRFSPSEIFVKGAKSQGAEIIAHDPLVDYWNEVNMDIKTELPDSTDFEAIVFAVPHKEFAEISLNKWIIQNSTLLFDANNVLSKKQVSEIEENKLNYMSIGRG
jgi:nucleotide sugar dehydrogenase